MYIFLSRKFFEATESLCVKKICILSSALSDFSDCFNCSLVRIFIDAICRSTSR